MSSSTEGAAAPTELVEHVARSTGLDPLAASRVVAEVVSYFDETPLEYVRRRHRELQGRALRNPEIWRTLADELEQRRFAAAPTSDRQLRRMVYG
ncbi:MAG: hypothetical protein JWM85_161 [Acidimicrobiaceae bacterium]|nr:hypothetical protein [Acidimicrobiaceae bacterium]